MVNLQYRIFTSEIDIIECDWNKFQPHLFINNWYNSCTSVSIWVNPIDKSFQPQIVCVHPIIPGCVILEHWPGTGPWIIWTSWQHDICHVSCSAPCDNNCHTPTAFQMNAVNLSLYFDKIRFELKHLPLSWQCTVSDSGSDDYIIQRVWKRQLWGEGVSVCLHRILCRSLYIIGVRI